MNWQFWYSDSPGHGFCLLIIPSLSAPDLGHVLAIFGDGDKPAATKAQRWLILVGGFKSSSGGPLCFLPRDARFSAMPVSFALGCPAAGSGLPQEAGRAATGTGSVSHIIPYCTIRSTPVHKVFLFPGQYCTVSEKGLLPGWPI